MMRRHPLASFLVLAYGWSWGFGLPLMASRRGWWGVPVPEALEMVSACGPLVAALVVSAALAGTTGPRNLAASMTRWRVGAAWLAFSALSPFALLAVAAVVLRAAGGAWPDLAAPGAGRLATAVGVVHLVIVGGLVQALGEEPGWRGFLLPRLRRRHAPLVATLLLFPCWLFWHLPSFLGRPEFGLPQFFAFSLGVLAAAVWLTLIHERTQSVLMAFLWHAAVNVARGIALALSTPLFLAMSTLVLAGALLIAGRWLLAGRSGGASAEPAIHPD